MKNFWGFHLVQKKFGNFLLATRGEVVITSGVCRCAYCLRVRLFVGFVVVCVHSGVGND